MLFGDNGYTGPNGENLISLKQFYNEQSGGTLNINGTVTDWYSELLINLEFLIYSGKKLSKFSNIFCTLICYIIRQELLQ